MPNIARIIGTGNVSTVLGMRIKHCSRPGNCLILQTETIRCLTRILLIREKRKIVLVRMRHYHGEGAMIPMMPLRYAVMANWQKRGGLLSSFVHIKHALAAQRIHQNFYHAHSDGANGQRLFALGLRAVGEWLANYLFGSNFRTTDSVA